MLIPYTNNTDLPCEGVELLEAWRPTPSAEFIATNLASAAVVAVIFLFTLVPLYSMREEPRFFKVRPFIMIAFYNISYAGYAFATLLPETLLVAYPCALTLFFHVVGATIIITMLLARALVFVVETQYSKLVVSVKDRSKSRLDKDIQEMDEESSRDEVASESPHMYKADKLGRRMALKDFISMGFFCASLESLSVAQLANLRKHYTFVLGAVPLPPILVFGLSAAVIPVFHSDCLNCMMFVETILIIMVTPVLTLIMTARFVYWAYRLRHTDEQQVFQVSSYYWKRKSIDDRVLDYMCRNVVCVD
jgi:hypothetical protein